MKRRAILLTLVALAARAEIVDRVAVTFENRVITESDLRREIRLAAFLEQKTPDLGAASRRRSAQRLVDRTLMDREMQLSRFPPPAAKEADALLAGFRKEHFPEDAAFHQALAQYRIQESELRDFLLAQITVLRFIEFRFRPSVQIRESEIQEYYRSRVQSQARAESTPPPSLDSARIAIEKILTDEAVDRMLDQWMKDTRTRTRIVFHEKAFQ